MFDWIKLRKNYFIGVDFGTSAIKVVELSFRNQKIYLENYGWADLGFVPDINKQKLNHQMSYDKKLNLYLKNLIRRLDPKSNKAFVSLPGFNGLIALIEFPEMSDDELEKAIQFEAHKYIPVPLEEVSLSWDVVKRSPHSRKLPLFSQKAEVDQKIQIVLAAAPLKEISRYENIFSNVGIDIEIIELETFSLARSIVGDDLGTFIVIDIGARATNIVLVEKSVVKINRNLDVGGNEITNSIAEAMNISKARAEVLKKEKKDILNNREFPVVIPMLDLITGETLRLINSYRANDKNARIDGVILSGGSAKMPNISEYFSKSLNIKTTMGNPWRRVVVDKRIEPIVQSLGTSFSVALGLAFRGIEEYQRK